MATIKAIEGRTVHQIQSGQVIVDLCSVVKELVENGLDADATSIDVRFKSNGLESIEVQDNGNGIAQDNYETIALKHYTSKLSTYDDLSSLQTFGFRGEALSSLCALSTFHLVTAQAHEAPKGTRLDFDTSGKLKSTSVVASQKGTTVAVEALFANLPVRRRELEKNVKREYTKVLGILQAYACISTSVKFAVSNILAKSKRVVVFATKSNTSTRDNIANVFGAKTLFALVSMDLRFDLRNTKGTISQANQEDSRVRILGHVSKPVFGEGRQTPDRQMFFVNARPCVLPQFAKVFNEVYKSYNVSQSPFVFANIIIDTNAYDVNVSPDKRTILLHEQNELLESLRSGLVELFEEQDQTVPQTQRHQSKLPKFKQLTVQRHDSAPGDPLELHANLAKQTGNSSGSSEESGSRGVSEGPDQSLQRSTGFIGRFAGRDAQYRNRSLSSDQTTGSGSALPKAKQKLIRRLETSTRSLPNDQPDEQTPTEYDAAEETQVGQPNPVADFNKRIAELQEASEDSSVSPLEAPTFEEGAEDDCDSAAGGATSVKPVSGVVQNAFDRMRPRRGSPQVTTITIGTKITTTTLGTSSARLSQRAPVSLSNPKEYTIIEKDVREKFNSSLEAFAGPGATRSKPMAKSRSIHKTTSLTNPAPTSEYTDDDESQVDAGASSDQEPAARDPGNAASDGENSDEEYLDDESHKVKQDAKVADLIQQAEEKLAAPSEDNIRRAGKILKGRGVKDSTTQLLQSLTMSVNHIQQRLQTFEEGLQEQLARSTRAEQSRPVKEEDPEQKLSLTVSKEDFSRMDIVGQFNLGFILASRSSTSPTTDDELFIIDQHACDEKYNFERLQASTTVQNQPLVRPKVLDLTAIEEEIIIENNGALLENGFVVEIDQNGNAPVGQRCKLLSLPMSREVTFDPSDLEELIALIGESPPSTSIIPPEGSLRKPTVRHIPRPSKVRKLFAMRACRSSVMIGRTLQKRQMEKLVRHMGELDKPWNCPHGRPTMRHVIGLGAWDEWREGDGLCASAGEGGEGVAVDWKGWLASRQDEEGYEETDFEDGPSAAVPVAERRGERHPEMSHGLGGSEDEADTVEDAVVSEEGQSDVDAEDDTRDPDESNEHSEGEEGEDDEDRSPNARMSISQRFLCS